MAYFPTTLIKNCWMVDGTGAEPVRRAILIENGRIKGIEPEITGSAVADTVFLGHGEIVSPGFIDAHGHSDLSLLARPEGFSKLSQGVTTEIAGNCGLSAFPLSECNREHLQELYREYGIGLGWHDCAGYLAALAERRPALKLYPLCGHNTLHAAVAGYEKRELAGSEIDEMCRQLQKALQQGAVGLSAGLLYVPGKFTSPEETVALMKVVAKAGKIYTTHLRSEGKELLEALDETLECAGRAGLKKLQISHFKTAGQANWHKLEAAIERIETARKNGIAVTIDRYPYTKSMTQLSVVLPGAWEELDDGTIQCRLSDPVLAENAELLLRQSGRKWDQVILVRSSAKMAQGGAGKTIAELAAQHRMTPESCVIKILAQDAVGTAAAFSGMSEANLRRIISLDYCCCGTDESARPADFSIGTSHPRGFGSFPRFLAMRLADGCSPGKAVRQLTGLPAEIFGLKEAGCLRVGAPADLVIFDPDSLSGSEDFTAPHTPAQGIKAVFSNGKSWPLPEC